MGGTARSGDGRSRLLSRDLIPREFLRSIAVWSLIPSYLVAGGFFGYLADNWLGWFPYLTGAGLLFALFVAVRDMLRLREFM
ncbi:MAG: hypothetical protein IBX62_04330 [Coriobacteriia bacterium]|nr:hypothetical protein [Coriobacteriia bacterium]